MDMAVAVLRRYLIALRILGQEPRDYVIKFVIPLSVMGIVFPIAMRMAVPGLVTGAVQYVLYTVPLILISLALLYPMTIVTAKEAEINRNLHYFITHMGVLATADIGHKEVIKQLSENEAYEYLAEEMRKIYNLMDNWNLSFAQSCRFIARRTPSELLADFLDRFAHATDSGMEMDEFLTAEQEVVMNDFETMYRGSLSAIDMIKEMYTSMVMSLIFLTSFAVIMPILLDMDGTVLMIGSAVLFVGTESLIVYFSKLRVPQDKIWHGLDIITDADRRMMRSFPVSIAGCIIAGVLVILYGKLPTTIMIAIALTPLVYTGVIASIEEGRVKRKDANFPAFIRSLGSSAGARGGSVGDTLGKLIAHDFGPLTEDIVGLYKRLKTRINKLRSWEYFAAGVGSKLIERFGTIFVEGTHQGGKAEVIGDIISENFHRIFSLRKLRYQSANSLIGVLYGLTAGISFTMFTSLSIVDILNGIYMEQSMPTGINIGLSLSGALDLQLLSLILMVMMVGHSFISSMLIKVVDGGHFFNSYPHFVGMVWVSSICAEVAMRSFKTLLGG